MVEKTIRLTGSSANGVQEAIELAIARAAVTIDGITKAHATDLRMEVTEGKVIRWIADVEITFEIKEGVHG